MGIDAWAPLDLFTQIIGRRIPAMVPLHLEPPNTATVPSPHGKDTQGFFLSLSFSLHGSDGSE